MVVLIYSSVSLRGAAAVGGLSSSGSMSCVKKIILSLDTPAALRSAMYKLISNFSNYLRRTFSLSIAITGFISSFRVVE